MAVQKIVTADGGVCQVTGFGYEPVGVFEQNGKKINISHQKNTLELCRGALLCNDASLIHGEKGWSVEGDPMEGALVSLAVKAGFEQDLISKQLPRLDEIPFDAEHRFMATLHHDHKQGAKFMIVKGAPEKVIAMCDFERHKTGDYPMNAAYWHAQTDQLASQGERVLA